MAILIRHAFQFENKSSHMRAQASGGNAVGSNLFNFGWFPFKRLCIYKVQFRTGTFHFIVSFLGRAPFCRAVGLHLQHWSRAGKRGTEFGPSPLSPSLSLSCPW